VEIVVETLVRTLHRLQSEKQKRTPTFYEIAKEMEGTDLLSDQIAAILELPNLPNLFIRIGSNRIGLNEVGNQVAQELLTRPRHQSEMQTIAATIKRYASKLKNEVLAIKTISLLARTDRKHIYVVEVDLEESIVSNDTPVKLWPNGSRPVEGRVVGQEPDDNLLYIAFQETINPADCLPANLSIDRAYLLRELANAIAAQPTLPARAKAMFGQEPRGVRIHDRDSATVAETLACFPKPWTKFLWGPPGAGKTYGIGRFICELLEKEPQSRILLVAPSNLAVDTALAQMVNQLAERPALAPLLDQHQILRFGYPRKSEILSRPELLGSEAERVKSNQIRQLSEQIRALAEQEGQEATLVIKRTELLELQEELKELTKAHVGHCRVVATTTTLAYMPSSPISQVNWHNVIVDEVTMVPPAMCVYLCALAQERILFAGDPRQLGPVFSQDEADTAEERRWLAKDIFDFAGLAEQRAEACRIRTEDRRLARITRQRRCAPMIWEKVAHLYPEVACDVDPQRIAPLQQFPPVAGGSFLLANLANYPAARCQRKGSSWQNELSAQWAMRIVDKMLEHAKAENRPAALAIITPYRAQVKLLRSMIKARQDELQLGSSTLAIGTIHEFQGSEADLVIFDLVDGPGRGKLGQLLSGDAGVRLVNVAVTRARGKVILLANREWHRNHASRQENPLLWDMLFAQ